MPNFLLQLGICYFFCATKKYPIFSFLFLLRKWNAQGKMPVKPKKSVHVYVKVFFCIGSINLVTIFIHTLSHTFVFHFGGINVFCCCRYHALFIKAEQTRLYVSLPPLSLFFPLFSAKIKRIWFVCWKPTVKAKSLSTFHLRNWGK